MEGIELYKKAFGAKVLCVLKNKDANPMDYVSDARYSVDWQPFFGQIYTEHKTSFITPGLSPFSLGL